MQQLAASSLMTFVPAETRSTELDDLEAVIRQYRSRVLRFAVFALGDLDAAESITQDCFLKAYNARHSFRGDCSVSTWLLGIASNLVKDHTRTQKFKFWRRISQTASQLDTLSQVLANGQASAEQTLLARERVVQVGVAVQHLTEKQRIVFVMRFLEELELSEIASATGMKLATVKTHLHRAVLAVRAGVRAASATRPTPPAASGATS